MTGADVGAARGALGEAFAGALRDRRSELNQRFEQARHQYPQLQGEDLLAFLRGCVNAVAEAISRVDASAVEPFVAAAYDAALVLCGQKLVGPGGRFPVIEAGWREVLPAAAPLLVKEPGRVIAAVSNALHTLATSTGARPNEWITTVARLAPRCADTEAFLKVGQIAAWRAGLAHLRDGALAVADTLPPNLAAAAVSAAATTGTAFRAPDGGNWPALRARLGSDVWFDPAIAGVPTRGPRVVKETGAFRGLGGLFLLPPEIAATDGGWLVRSAGQHWFAAVDAFGATFHRATAEEWNSASHEPTLPPGARLAGPSLVNGGFTLPLPVIGPVTSVATSGSTIAITSAHTHSVTFVSLN